MARMILARDDTRLTDIRSVCAHRAGRDPAARTQLQEAERRLAVVAQMRALYTDLRAAKARMMPPSARRSDRH
jgi:hypothetical protein